MKAQIIYISKKKNSKAVILGVDTFIGPVYQSVTGWVKGLNVPKNKLKLRAVIDIPATKVELVTKVSKDGTVFNYLHFS